MIAPITNKVLSLTAWLQQIISNAITICVLLLLGRNTLSTMKPTAEAADPLHRGSTPLIAASCIRMQDESGSLLFLGAFGVTATISMSCVCAPSAKSPVLWHHLSQASATPLHL